MSVPYWRQASTPNQVRAEVAILGGGVMGVAAALALERRGVDALIIERGEIASGASGRNAGFLMRGAADNYAVAIGEWGRERARQVWRTTERNLSMLRSEGIERVESVRRVPSCLLGLEPIEAGELHASADLMRDDGFDVEIIESGDDAVWRSSAPPLLGLVNPDDGACNPADVLRFLASKVSRAPLCHQEATSILIEGSDRVRLRTSGCMIECRRLLVCTNAYTALLLPGLSGVIEPKRGQVFAFRTPRPVFDHSYYANRGGEYFRQPYPDVAIMGGWRRFFADVEVGYEDRVSEGVQRGLEGFLDRFVPGPHDVLARWSGVMGFTRDGLPLVGPINERGEPVAASPVWLSAGCTGHGMSMFFATAHDAVASMLEGSANPFPLTRFG